MASASDVWQKLLLCFKKVFKKLKRFGHVVGKDEADRVKYCMTVEVSGTHNTEADVRLDGVVSRMMCCAAENAATCVALLTRTVYS